MPDLTPRSLAAEWKKGNFRPAYYLFGEDGPAKNLAIDTLKKMVQPDEFNLTEVAGENEDAAAAIVEAASTPPMFSGRRLVIVRNVKFKTAARKRIAEYLRDPLDTTILAMVSPERRPEAKDPIAAAVRALGGVAVFKPLSEGEASTRLVDEAKRLGFSLDLDAASFMVEEAGTEWGILRAELQKVALFAKETKKADRNAVAACLGYSSDASPFDLPRHIQKRDRSKAISLLKRLMREGNDPYRLLYQVTQAVNKQLKAKRLVKSGAPQDQIFRQLRLNSYYDRDFLEVAGKISEPALIRSLRACLETEVAIKSQAWLDPEMELERLVAAVCRS